MKKILFFFAILLLSNAQAQINPIPYGSPIQIKLKSGGTYITNLYTNLTDTFTQGYGVTGIYTFRNNDSDICFRYNGGSTTKCVSAIGTVGGVYTAGIGITLNSGTNFSHTAHIGDATGITSLTVVALRGYPVLATIPTSGNVLTYDGANWYPLAPTTGRDRKSVV